MALQSKTEIPPKYENVRQQNHTKMLIYPRGSKSITVQHTDPFPVSSYPMRTKQRKRKKVLHQRWISQPGKRDYTHFTAIKSMLTTSEAIQRLSKQSGLLPKRFEYCGNKDKRAVTFQRISVWRAEDDAKALKEKFEYSQSIICRDFVSKQKSLKLGDLAGNLFFVKIRPTRKDQSLIDLEGLEKAIKNHGTDRFLNLFGVQRFGYPLFINPEVGKLLLKGDYRAAVLWLLMSPVREEVESGVPGLMSLELLRSWINGNEDYSNRDLFMRLHELYTKYIEIQWGSLQPSITLSIHFESIKSLLLTPSVIDITGCGHYSMKVPKTASSIQRTLYTEISKQLKQSKGNLDGISFSKAFHKLQDSVQQLFVNSYQSQHSSLLSNLVP